MYPFIAWFGLCVVCCKLNVRCISISTTNKSFVCILSYILAIIPIAFYMMIAPFYLFFAWIWRYYVQKDMTPEESKVPAVLSIGYVVPHNILHLIIWFHLEIDDIVLYLLLITCIFVAISWYFVSCHEFFQFKQHIYKQWMQNMVTTCCFSEILLIILWIIPHYGLHNDNNKKEKETQIIISQLEVLISLKNCKACLRS